LFSTRHDPTTSFPPPWTVDRPDEDSFVAKDANGIVVATVHYRDDLQKWSFGHSKLIAKAIARIPEFMMQRRGFYSRGPGNYRWKPARPHHVAFDDGYIRAQRHVSKVLCKLNGIPFDSTGEKIKRDGLWCVYEFGQQLDAMMAWDRFQGRWLRGEKFSYPERPQDMPTKARPWNEKPPDLRR
jgi:hypothetical protein